MLLFLTLGFSPATVHAQQTPCDCAQRWEKGAHWNPDGTINDAPNAPAPLGIIRCGSSAETQAQLIPGTCTYNPNQFYIDVELAPCVEPSTGVSVSAKNPKAGQPIIWLNFDVRANAGSFQVQINDNSGDKIAWALYYSTTHQAGVNNNGLSGNCNTLVFAACGVESASTWNTLPVPSFSQPTNYYMAIWDQNADGNLAVNNFKARFGCGDADVLVCNLEVSPETTQCQEDTYTVEIPIQGINSNYVGYDPNATPPTSAPVCLTNSGTTDVTSGTIIMTYPQSVTNYNIEISIDDNPDDDCPDPANPGDCSTIVSGTAPDCCTGPVISCPEDVTVSCEQSLDPADIGSAEAAEGCGEVTISHTDELFPGGCATETIIKRTWTATDEDGNTDDCVQTITVQDNTAPIPPPAPQNITISCSGLVPEPVELMALDNCGGEIPGIPSSGIIVGECVNEYEIERVWIFTDACGNTSSVSQTITVKDTEAPATPEPPADATYQCAAEVPVAESLTTTDNCEGELTVMPTEETFPSECASDFVLIRTWTFADECGNSTSVSQTITVQDTEAPATPEPPADATYQCASDVPAADVLSTTDNCDGDLTTRPTEATFPGECANDYVLVRTWTFTDQCGNSSSVSQTITVKDTEAPATPAPPADATYQCADEVPVAEELSTTDNCDGEIIVMPTETTMTGSCANDVVFIRTWTFTDQCGNSSSVSQTLTVKDTEAPATPEAPADITVQCAGDVPAIEKLTTTDNCSGELSALPTEQLIVGSCPNDYTIVRTWTFTDDCGNSTSVSQTITVKDTEAPVAPEPPADITIQCTDDIPDQVDLTATDNCDGDITVSPDEVATEPEICDNNYTITRTWTFTDQCGNSSSVSQLITVKDETAPVLLVELGLTNLSCVDQIPPYEEVLGLIGENIYDECDSGLPTVNLVEDTGEPNCIDGVFARTYSVEVCDACGNCAVYQLTYSGQCGEFCTLTQGGWGNAGGKYPWPDADGKATTTEIITALMDANGPIIIGDLAGNSLTIEDPDCVLALLPGGGPSGPLPTGTNVVNNGNNCKPADASMLNKQGRLNNNLVAQTVALQINVWYSSMAKGTNLGDLLLGGACLPINGSGLPETVQTVQDLLDYTNAYLGGAVSGGNSLSGALNTAVSGINEYFDGCKLPPVFKEQPADDPVDEEPTGEEPLTCDEFCTLTQGGWGNAGGQYTWNDADGKAYTEDIISALMDKYGDIILGNPQSMRSLTVKDPGCAITLLPAGGSAMPLPAGHAFSSKPNKCRVYGTDQQRKNGRLNNVLAGQVVALQLNIWYSSEMYGSDLGATTLGGECLPVNTEGLPPSIGTVADLLNYANLVLNNQVGSDYAGLLLTGQSDLPTQLAPVLTDAITKVNEYFDGCQPAAFVNEHLVTDRMNDPQLDITAGLKELRLTPNPAMDQVTIDFNTSEEGETRLRINDLQGREVYRAEQLSVTGNNMFRVNTDDLSSGLYIVTLLQGDALLQSKLVIVKE
ncbi:MAG: T9SS type A sorting domain-containing protein [Lewinella sp.]|nr:T9SS type A sorting domain-containing protein [Lewinella sp.]